MKKKVEVEVEYIRKSTAMVLIVIALVIGFGLGIAYSLFDKPATDGQIRSVSVQTTDNPSPSANTGVHDHTKDRHLVQIEKMKAAVQADPKDVKSWIQLGNSYFDVNRVQEAIASYNRALDLEPNNPNVWTDLGVMYRRSGNPAQAIKAFERAIAINPKHEIARFNRGIVMMHDLRDIEGALKSWEDLLAINPEARTPGGQSLQALIDEIKAKQGK